MKCLAGDISEDYYYVVVRTACALRVYTCDAIERAYAPGPEGKEGPVTISSINWDFTYKHLSNY